MAQFSFEAIGTHWTIDIYDAISDDAFTKLQTGVHARIEQYDVTYSRFRKDSLITKMSQNSGVYTFPEDAPPLFDLYEKLYELTDGKFTPLIGNTLEQAGYDAEYSLEAKPDKSTGELTKPRYWNQVLKINFPTIEVSEPIMLDVGAAGKGYLVDIVSELILSQNINSFCVDAGGDIVYRNATGQALEVALENPNDINQAVGVARILNQSLCGSATNRRKWGEYNHIINPQTLKSPKDIIAVWVVADSGLIADGLSTALFLSPPEAFQSDFSFEYLIIYIDSSIQKSDNFPAEMFYQ